MYTDSNITTFSRANALDKYTKLLQNYRDYAKDLESRYYSVKDGQSTLGDITKDE